MLIIYKLKVQAFRIRIEKTKGHFKESADKQCLERIVLNIFIPELSLKMVMVRLSALIKSELC